MNEVAIMMAAVDTICKIFTAIGVCVIAIKMKK